MKRVVIIGQPGQHGPLSCTEFAQQVADHLGMASLPPAPQQAIAARAVVQDDEAWVAAEPAGLFSEEVFRRADTVVWLNFSPRAFLRDWVERWPSRAAATASLNPQHAGLHDVYTSLVYFLIAPQMYQLMRHPALAHVNLYELRTPEQARFWLRAQEQRLRGPALPRLRRWR
jgi:hypothetical protein